MKALPALSSSDAAAARVWLFDFDNTLVALEREVDWAASRVELERWLRREGIGDALFRAIPKGNLPLYEALRARLNRDDRSDLMPASGGYAGSSPTALLQGASAIVEAYELRGVDRAAALPGAVALLRTLKVHKKTIVIVTSNSSRTIACWLAREQLASLVDAIVGRDALLPLKPAPDSVLRALQLCAATAAEAIFIGDSAADAGAACAAEVRFCAIGTRSDTLAQACASFASPAELARWLGFSEV